MNNKVYVSIDDILLLSELDCVIVLDISENYWMNNIMVYGLDEIEFNKRGYSDVDEFIKLIRVGCDRDIRHLKKLFKSKIFVQDISIYSDDIISRIQFKKTNFNQYSGKYKYDGIHIYYIIYIVIGG